MACLDDLTITNLVGNALPDDARAAALAHLDDCRSCCDLVAAIAAGSPRRTALPVRLATGTAVGRYVVDRELGAGAMGVVYAARDPSLGRAVALKCVAASGEPRARERMLREAHAMAQLSHRNVVSIYDVGTVGDDVFLAMELLPGRTLRQWLAEAERRPRAIVAALIEAGRGLAAAHAAGIVHRDIKPDNVLISDDGRACLTDFGLALAEGAPVEPAIADAPVDALTSTGQIVGTPVYMAPEQLAGGAADTRSDQFAFCVVLYEALAGRRPFEGRTIAELRAAIARGPAPASRVPAWLGRVIARGLAVDPDRRFPSMTALLAVLARDPAVRRRRVAAGAALAVVAAGIGFAIPRSHAGGCPDPRPRLAGAWDPARRAELARAFGAQARPFTAAMLAGASAALDRYADRWVALRGEVCRATYEQRDQSEARYDAEVACLERRRAELAAAVGVLVDAPDEQTVRNAVEIAQGLPDLQPCRDGEALVGGTPLPADPAARAQIDGMFQRLAAATTLAKTSKFAAAQAAVDEVIPRARALGFGPALGQALYLHGKLQMSTRDAKTAERDLNEAATVAAAAKDDALVARVWIQLAYTVGAMARRFPESASLGRVARAAVQRAGDRDDLVIEWHDAIGASLVEEAKYDDALDHFQAARALAEHASPLKLADQLSKVSAVLGAQGKLAEARAPLLRSLELLEANLGPDHPDLAFSLDALGGLDYDAGRFADAQRSYRRALAILDKLGEAAAFEATEALEGLGNAAAGLGDLDEARAHYERVLAIRTQLAPDDPHVGDALLNLAQVLHKQGHADDARRDVDRALALYRAAYGPTHPQVAVALRERAQLEMGSEQAVHDVEDALAITTAALGPDHPEVGVDLGNLGAAHAGLRHWPQAQDAYQRAVDHHTRVLGPTHWMTGMSLIGLGQAEIERGDAAHAIAVGERALAIAEANHAVPATFGLARMVLSRALWDGGGDRVRARALAVQALADLADARDPTGIAARAEVTAWLASHRR